jgi:hypothetical protein
VSAIAARLAVDASAASVWCEKRLPLNETIDLTVTQRIFSGDLEAIHDLIREAIEDLEQLAERAASLLCDDPAALKRLAEVRRRQEQTGRQWCRPPDNQETDATDRAGQEPRGPGSRQDNTPRARAGKRVRRRGGRS